MEKRKSREVQRKEKRYKKNANANYERIKPGEGKTPICTRLRNNGRDVQNRAKQQSSGMIRNWLAFIQCTDEMEIIVNRGGKFVSKETVVLRRWEYYKIIWFYQLG